MKTVREVLIAARDRLRNADCDSPEMESDLLLAFTLGVTRSRLLSMRSDPVDAAGLERFEALLERRLGREPLAYIVGGTEFYGRWFEVTPDVLIPRVDTETIVSLALAEIDRWGGSAFPLLELGVGSGCIMVSIVAERWHLLGYGVDVSDAALAITRRNAERHGVSTRLTLKESNWFESMPIPLMGEFALIVSNPPYIDPSERLTMQPEVAAFEPRHALFSDNNGLADIERILADAYKWLVPGGLLLMEIGYGQAEQAIAIARRFPYSDITTCADTAGTARVLFARADSLA